MTTICLRLWEEAFVTHFGKRSRRHLIALVCDLFIVDTGLKPAYLWDVLHPNAQKIESLIKHLHDGAALKNKLNVITLGEDIFVVHLKELVLHLKSLLRCNHETFLVDASVRLDKPVLAESSDHSIFAVHLRNIYSQLKNYIKPKETDNFSTKHGVINLEIDKSWSLSTVFGALLGYPVLYYCKDNNGHCLSMCPLRVFSVNLEILNSEFDSVKYSVQNPRNVQLCHTVYSFSVPDAIAAEVSKKIDSWFCSLIEKLQNHVPVLKLVIKEEITTPSIVTL